MGSGSFGVLERAHWRSNDESGRQWRSNAARLEHWYCLLLLVDCSARGELVHERKCDYGFRHGQSHINAERSYDVPGAERTVFARLCDDHRREGPYECDGQRYRQWLDRLDPESRIGTQAGGSLGTGHESVLSGYTGRFA